MNNYIYVIEYDGCVSREGYISLDGAINHLKEQGYVNNFGWEFECHYENKISVARIKDIKIV
ncbi:MAG: hypothetical protein RR359_04820 [Bacilli bacterium]